MQLPDQPKFICWVRLGGFWTGVQPSILKEQLSRAGKPETVCERQHFYFCRGPTTERVSVPADEHVSKLQSPVAEKLCRFALAARVGLGS